MMKAAVWLAPLALTFNAWAGPPTAISFEETKKVIEGRAGCFAVTYDFYDGDVIESDFHETATEFVALEWLDKDTASLQHVTIGRDPDDPTSGPDGVAMHWREQWTYQPKEAWDYLGNKTWEKAKGRPDLAENAWSYKIYQLDGSLRSENVGVWMKKESDDTGASQVYYKSTTNTPLPLREVKAGRPKDKEYSLLHRQLTILPGKSGFVELLNAQKVHVASLKDKKSNIVGHETGSTRLQSVDASTCAKAKAMWEAQKPYWDVVRATWQDVYEQNTYVRLPDYGLIGPFLGRGAESEKRRLVNDEMKGWIKTKIHEKVITTEK